MYIGGGFGCNPGAGRRSAGLGSEGAARAQSHAVGAREARPIVPCVSVRIKARKICGNLRGQRAVLAVCEGRGHWSFF